MGQLTEAEIFDCLKSNARMAAEDCDRLAVLPRTGPSYKSLCDKLKLVEGACRQAAYWREDTRWLRFGRLMEEVHKAAGNWLRGAKDSQGRLIKLADVHRHQCFTMLAANLRAIIGKVDECQTKATGRLGVILPVVQAAPHRDTRPVHITVPDTIRRPSGLILPAGMR